MGARDFGDDACGKSGFEVVDEIVFGHTGDLLERLHREFAAEHGRTRQRAPGVDGQAPQTTADYVGNALRQH